MNMFVRVFVCMTRAGKGRKKQDIAGGSVWAGLLTALLCIRPSLSSRLSFPFLDSRREDVCRVLSLPRRKMRCAGCLLGFFAWNYFHFAFLCVFFLGRVREYDLLVIRVVCDIFYFICAFVISSHYVLICNSDFDKSLFLLLNSLHNLLI